MALTIDTRGGSMKEVARDVYQWSQFSEEKQLNFNGYCIVFADEQVIVDPPLLADDDLALIKHRGPLSAILITNRDHLREAERYRALFRTKILVPELDAPVMGMKPDGIFRHGDRPISGLQVIHIPDGKSPGESAFLIERNGGTLILGDALIGKPPGTLSLLPPDKFADVKKARAGLAVLMGYAFDMVLVGDGTSIMIDGKEAVRQALAGR